MDCRTVQQKIMPYIERKLSDAELEEFLDHVQHCTSCSEELEVYFTIYYALQKLDSDDVDSFDMKEILRNDMDKMQRKLHKNESVRFMKKLFYVTIGIVIGITIFVGTDALIHGGIQNTVIYQWITDEETEESTNRINSLPIHPTEKAEPETNHKKQIIVTIPETEMHMEPGPIPD